MAHMKFISMGFTLIHATDTVYNQTIWETSVLNYFVFLISLIPTKCQIYIGFSKFMKTFMERITEIKIYSEKNR